MFFSFIYATAIDETVRAVKCIGGKCIGYKVDIAKKEDVYRAADEIRRDVGDVSNKSSIYI